MHLNRELRKTSSKVDTYIIVIKFRAHHRQTYNIIVVHIIVIIILYTYMTCVCVCVIRSGYIVRLCRLLVHMI